MPVVVAGIYGSASVSKLRFNSPNSGSDLITDPRGAAIKVTVTFTVAALAVFGLLTWRAHKSRGFGGRGNRILSLLGFLL